MAAYNNYFPQTYTSTPYVYGAGAAPAQTWTQPTPTQTQAGAISWVQGEAGARSVPVQPGQKALLMDSETNVFYVKSCDASGMPLPLRIFEYKEVGKVATSEEIAGAPSTYVTHEELEQALAELKQPAKKPKEEKSNEQFLI